MGLVKTFDSLNQDQIIKHKQLICVIAEELVPGYVWSDEIKPIANDLLHYFNGFDNSYDLNKSIALCGTYGVGKSILMKIFKTYMNRLPKYQFDHPNVFRIISIEDVIQSMSGKEDPIYSELLYNVNMELDRPIKKPANLLINEFGFKYDGKSYGTNYQELIEMFIMKRYDIFQEYGKMTHVTMNFGTSDLKNVFPDKIIDRFKEMFNIIQLGGESYRK